MPAYPSPKPLIDTLEKFNIDKKDPFFPDDWTNIIQFLKQYQGNRATFEAYRREIERILQWSWIVAKKSILLLSREDIENYLQFCLTPPKSWIAKKRVYRFLERDGKRIPNPEWRPFVATVTKSEYKQGITPNKENYHLSPKAIRDIFTVLNSFYNYLLIESRVIFNPLMLIKQKNRYIQTQQTQKQIRRLTDTQWKLCIETITDMATNNFYYHRILFVLSAMYLMYLRISEFTSSKRWTPMMNNFYQDSEQQWWFQTLGKGNKLRNIAVSNDMLSALKTYRSSLGLSPLPSPGENFPLIPKAKGRGPIEDTRHLRRLIQECFDAAAEKLKTKGLPDEAASLETATAHWLRHTGISDDINKRGRPLAHVRDDAGHTSVSTTDRYNDVEVKKRHISAVNKRIIENSKKEDHLREETI